MASNWTLIQGGNVLDCASGPLRIRPTSEALQPVGS